MPKNSLPKEEQIQALAEMQDELKDTKAQVDNFGSDLDDMSPSNMSYGDEADTGDMNDEDTEKVKAIKTPEDAKKALEEAKKDIQNVSDNFDALIGQTDEEEKTAKIKRPSEKYASSIMNLAKQADKAVIDAKGALTHWAFLLKLKKSPLVTANAGGGVDLSSAFNTLKQATRFVEEGKKLFTKEATSVPPTGADFSGDKWPNKKDPKEVEDRAWHAGQTKFDSDLTWEHKRTNPAVDERLTDVEYNYEPEKPYVNATLHLVEGENKYATYWDIFDTKLKQRMLVTFASIPDSIGAKDDNYLKLFASRRYGNTILAHITANGFDSVKNALDGKTAAYNFPSLAKTAADSKSNLRKYYTDAYGDRPYASALASGEGGGDKSKMDVAYTPEETTVKDADTNTKDGPGTISKQRPSQQKVSSNDTALIQAAATKSVELAKFAASRGLIPFTANEIRKKAAIYFKYSDAEFKAVEATLNEMPLVNKAALKEAHIPDVETGIVGNTKEGVRDPKAKVNTEDLNSNVDSDAKIAKQAGFVPQVTADNDLNKKPMFRSRIVDNLAKKGVLNQTKKPNYKIV